MLQNLREVVPPLGVLRAAVPGALDCTGNEQPFQFLFAADYAGGFALAHRHPLRDGEDVPKQAVFDFLTCHAMRFNVMVASSLSRIVVQRIPLERSGSRRVQTMVRMVSAFAMGKVSTSPTFMLRIVSVVLFDVFCSIYNKMLDFKKNPPYLTTWAGVLVP